jgi:hypothetical protein
MNFSRFRFWLALLAFAFHAMSPVMSHAMFANSGKSLVEICTPDGFKTVEVDEGGKTTPSLNHYPHCGDCLVSHDGAAPPPNATPSLPAPMMTGVVKLSSGTVAFASALRLAAPPRGPPARS